MPPILNETAMLLVKKKAMATVSSVPTVLHVITFAILRNRLSRISLLSEKLQSFSTISKQKNKGFCFFRGAIPRLQSHNRQKQGHTFEKVWPCFCYCGAGNCTQAWRLCVPLRFSSPFAMGELCGLDYTFTLIAIH